MRENSSCCFGPVDRRSYERLVLVAMLAIVTLSLDSCFLKKAQKGETKAGTIDTTHDTSQGYLSRTYDSLTNTWSNKVSGFLHSLLPPGKDTTKGQLVFTPPQPEQTPPGVTSQPPSIPGFLGPPIKRQLQFDSTGNVTLHDVFLGADVNQPETMTFDEYIRRQEELQLQSGYEQNVRKSLDTGKTVEATTGILGDYNTIQIPIPPSVVPTIFGRPSINLRVSGDVAIHLAYRDNQTYATSGSNFFGSETGLDFKQEINVSTNGTIGDKLKIGADWGSDRMFQFDNLLKFNYVGYPDEILQSFDAGNVTFNPPSQYIGAQQDLFGLKAITRFGPVYVTTLAAQKKGERQSKSFGGGSGIAQEHVIRPWEYRRNRFFLDTSFISYYEPYYSTIPPNVNAISGKPVVYDKSVEVWVTTTNQADVKRRQAVAWYNLPEQNGGYAPAYRNTKINGSSDTVMPGFWIRLDTNRYTYDVNTGVLVLSQEPDDQQALAVSYRTSDSKQHGDPETVTDTLVLKLIKPKYAFANVAAPAWQNILKNTYYIGGAGFTDKDFSGRIIYQQPNGKQKEYFPKGSPTDPLLKAISVLGLDRYNNTNHGDRSPDGQVDFWMTGVNTSGSFIVDPRTGTLVFPYLEPFGSHIAQFDSAQIHKNKNYKIDTTFSLPEIYNTTQEELRLRETKQVSINIKFSGGVSATLNLNAFNLVEGSVKVTNGGVPLVEGKDYRVDYNSGTVTLLNPDLVTGGQINVEYDVHDIFTNATKNVLALRAEVPMGEHGVIGTTLMNYSMHLPTLKTRQGEEPLSNWIWGMDGSYKVDAPWLTDAMNALPFFNLKDKSELSIRGDAALSLPNPNTDKSPMPVDNGQAIAYLDDFEGGLNEFPLYMNYGRWVPSSQPGDSAFQSAHPSPDSIAYWDNALNRLKGQLWWNVPYYSLPPVHEIKPNQQTATPSETATVMDVNFDPTQPGIYNPYPDLTNPKEMWGGMTQYAPGLNVAATNTDAIQFWVQVRTLDNADLQDSVVMHFDLGRISEDIVPNKKLDNEDSNQSGRYDPGEDVGLDGMTNDAEQRFFSPSGPGQRTPFNESDPSNDNYVADANNPAHINGQEGNEQDAYSGLKPDNEDLDGNGSVNLDNGYYEYDIPLNMKKYVVGNTNNVWFQMRIPLADYKRIVGTQDSSFSNISYYRMWFKGFQKPVQLRFYEFMLVGSQWTRASTGLSATNPVADTSLKVNYVNVNENSGPPTNYVGPDGVAYSTVPAGSSYIRGNEQSLNMQLSKVPISNTNQKNRREATRLFPNPNDIFNYVGMSIWAHGDETSTTPIPSRPLQTPVDTTGRVWIYWRFGTDQFNYYEYRRPLVRGWQNLHVDFNKFTALKAQRNANQLVITAPDPENQAVGATYSVVGSPNFTNAPYFVLGAENDATDSITTDIWWDELRLLGANDKPGFAYNASTQMKLAEFGRISAGMINEQPEFHRVDERFNTTRSLNLTWNVTGEFSMEKMLPKWMEDKQTKLPLTISHSESILRPKYIVNTDVDLNNAIQGVQNDPSLSAQEKQYTIDSLNVNNETLLVKNSIGASDIALRFPGSFFLIPALINRLNFGFGYGEQYLRSPQSEYDRRWSWTGSGRYSLPPLPSWSVSPLGWLGSTTILVGPYSGWKINPFPSQVSFAISATRGRTNSLNRLSTLTLPPEGSDSTDTLAVLRSRVPIINRIFTATRGMQINWKPFEGGLLSPGFEYALDVTSNLVPLETRASFNSPVRYDSLGRPIYDYDSVYYFQRSVSDIAHDIFLKNGALARLGDDYLASQRVHMSTLPRLPGLFGLEKLLRPVFDYRVEYKWQDAQTGLQNAKQGAWNNTITTGLELNVRDLGTMIFGKPAAEEQSGNIRGRRDRGEVGITPEELHERGGEERESPMPLPRDETRNQVERGEEMRPQSRPNPLGRNRYITDTLKTGRTTPGVTSPIDTNHIHQLGLGTEGEKGNEFVVDTVLTAMAPPPEQPGEQAEETPKTPPITVKDVLQTLVQKPLFDWNGTRFNFTQTNQSLNGALAGIGSGISNFLAKGIFVPEDDQNGPSRAYQLGLITDPAGRLLFHWHPAFPFLSFSVRPGLRAADPFGGSTDIIDAFTETNNFELATSRPLWSGATINLNWKVSFGYDERDALHVDQFGQPIPQYTIKSGDVSRTFFSIPPLPFFGDAVLQSGILRVGQKYRDGVLSEEQARGLPSNVDTARFLLPADVHNKIERDAFMNGFETLPLFTGFLREYLPRLNYSFSWTGLEKFPLFTFADHASMRNAYNGTYRRSFRQDPGDSLNLTSLQTIVYGFRPLIAVDMSWDKIWGGHLTSTLNYDSQTEWAADYASTRITKRLSTTFGINANFQRQGLSIPFLKLNLKNEFTASFMLSETISADSYFNFWSITDADGISNGGLTKTTIEPRVGYSVSQQLTMEAFYRYERTTPASTGLISPPTRLIMAGFDVRLKIQ